MSIYGSVGSLVEMSGYLKEVKPNLSSDGCHRFLNQAVRSVCRQKTWSDLLKFIQIPIPNATATGSVTVATNSATVTGSGTGWPTNDLLSTTVVNKIPQPGMQRVIPSAMNNPTNGFRIIPGTWLLADAGTANQEAVAVIEVTPNSFFASFQRVHDPNFTLWCSSLQGLQFRTTYPFYTVTGVPTSTQILLDLPWADASGSGLSYQVLLAYCKPDPYAWRLIEAHDPVQGVPLDVDNYTWDQVIAGDPQLTASDDPTILCPVPPDATQVPRWFIYPPQVSQRYIVAKCDTVWPRMIADQDRCPPFISPDVFILKAQSMALRTKTITQNMPRDPYYDPAQAMEFERMFKEELETFEQADEARLAHRLQSWDKLAAGQFSALYVQSHPGWPSGYIG